ncbi:MAG: hypothetical protein ACRDZ4_13585 [Egibacteraceae bacterium]
MIRTTRSLPLSCELRVPLVTVAAEADHLVLTRLGIDVELQFLDDLA